MSTIKIEVCARCGRESCDGVIWVPEDADLGLSTPDGKACTWQTVIRDGKRQYHYVMGHGCDWYVDLKREEPT